MMTFKEYLIKHGACGDAVAFVGDQTLRQAWESATRPDWMIWLLLKAGYQDDQMYRLFGCWCAANTPLADGRVTWDLLTDNRSRKAILVAIDYANGEATSEELAAAWAAAWAAARAAASDAAWAAARAAARAAASDAASAAASDAASDAQAKELRRRVDIKKLERLVKKGMVRR